jgi:hypothetical protein
LQPKEGELETGYRTGVQAEDGGWSQGIGPLIGPANEPAATVAAIKRMGFDYFMIENEHSLVARMPSTSTSGMPANTNCPS